MLCCLPLLAPMSLWALKFTMPEDVRNEDLEVAPEEETDYGDTKNPLDGSSEEIPEPIITDAGSEAEEAPDVEADEADFIEIPLLATEAEIEPDLETAVVEEALAEGEGRIVGQIFDKETGAPIRGVAIAVEGTDLGTITDESGNFRLNKVPEGVYTLAYFKTGYLEANITDVGVESGEVKTLDFALPPRPAETSGDVYDLGTITVTADQANDLMMQLDLQKLSITQLDVMSAEEFSKYAASDIADAVKSVTGVSISDGKYAVVRGLNDRYSVTQLNGFSIPSPDPDRAAVPLDTFPTGIFDSIETRKTNSPDLPGEASGGVIDLRIKRFPEERTIKFTLGGGFNSNSQNDWLSTERHGSKDFFANGTELRDFDEEVAASEGPFDIINNPPGAGISELFAAIGTVNASTTQIFTPQRDTPDPDVNASIFYGETFNLGDKSKLGLILAYNQRWRSRYRNEDVNRVTDTAGAGAVTLLGPGAYINTEFGTQREVGTFEALLSSLVGVSYSYDEKLNFDYNLLFTRSGIEEAILNVAGKRWQQDGQNATQTFDELGGDIDALTSRGESYTISQYTERSMYSNLLSLNLDMQEEFGLILDLGFLYAENEQIEPDTYDSRGLFGGNRFRRETTQDSSAINLDATFSLNDYFDFGDGHSIKVGFVDETSSRDYIQFQQNFQSDFDSSDPTAVFVGGSFVLDEGFKADGSGITAQADGFRDVTAHYFMFDTKPLDWLQIVGGFRFEKSNLGYDGFGSAPQAGSYSPELISERPIDQTDTIPSINVNIDLPKDFRLRLAYSETIARPTYRELQPFPVLNLETNEIEVGNPGVMGQLTPPPGNPIWVLGDVNGNPLDEYQGLRIGEVRNIDARFELYPTTNSMLAVGLFWKEVANPIERIQVANQDSSLPVFTFINNENTADMFGVEFECSQNLGELFTVESLDFFTIGGNLTFINAAVDRSNAELSAAEIQDFLVEDFTSDRPLYDQPDYIGNLFLNFEFEKIEADITLSINYTGQRLVSAAGSNTSDIYEDKVTTMNLVYIQEIKWLEGLSLKFSIRNFNDPTFKRITQKGDNKVNVFDESGNPVGERSLEEYTRGISYSISATYDF